MEESVLSLELPIENDDESPRMTEDASVSLEKDLRIMKKAFTSVYTNKVQPNEALEDFEFLGPSFICISLSTLMALVEKGGNAGIIFASTFISFVLAVFISAFTVSALSKSISVFNAVSIISYCLSIFIPISILSLLRFSIINIILSLFGFYFCFKAVYRIFIPKLADEKKMLGILPSLITFGLFSWFFATQNMNYQKK